MSKGAVRYRVCGRDSSPLCCRYQFVDRGRKWWLVILVQSVVSALATDLAIARLVRKLGYGETIVDQFLRV